MPPTPASKKKPASSGDFQVQDRPLSKKERLVRRRAEKAAKRRATKEEQHHQVVPEPSEGTSAAAKPHTLSSDSEEEVTTPNEGKIPRLIHHKSREIHHSPTLHPDRSDAESFQDEAVDDNAEEGEATPSDEDADGDAAADSDASDDADTDDDRTAGGAGPGQERVEDK